MKRIRLLILLGMVAVALPLGLLQGVAKGAGGSKMTTATGTYVSISQYADFNFSGTQLDVNLLVRCTGVDGVANVSVTQDRPETGGTATGDGFNALVVCDGRTHSVGVTIIGTIYDPGKAFATATVIAESGTATTSRWITIKVV
jgi:hypothetical protein